MAMAVIIYSTLSLSVHGESSFWSDILYVRITQSSVFLESEKTVVNDRLPPETKHIINKRKNR